MLSQLESEVREEPSLLERSKSVSVTPLPSGSILVGAGDSYAAALCASYLSTTNCVVLDPYELIARPRLARERSVVLISVSGRTRANLAAARAVKGIAGERVGVTSNEDSPLAREVDRPILLPFDYRPRSPGMASFTLSLAYAARLLSVRLGLDFRGAYSAGRRISRRLGFARNGCTFFLGNRALYAVSMFGEAKLFEFFGAKAQCQRLEEFSHMELFSLGVRDAVNVYDGFDPLRIGKALTSSLKAAGYEAFLAPTGRAGVASVFNAVFATQFAVLRWVRETRIRRPYIVGAKEKLMMSDSMIY